MQLPQTRLEGGSFLNMYHQEALTAALLDLLYNGSKGVLNLESTTTSCYKKLYSFLHPGKEFCQCWEKEWEFIAFSILSNWTQFFKAPPQRSPQSTKEHSHGTLPGSPPVNTKEPQWDLLTVTGEPQVCSLVIDFDETVRWDIDLKFGQASSSIARASDCSVWLTLNDRRHPRP